ncbi:hypothetical protein FOY51_05490 [Antrihabitans cavernicola]|uniref:Type II methyltransferase M.Eco57I C-terminal domain-containing protein n=1 Tax=Antrihabitans cavernicola TaxID=2495913 RepID=A0A5A7SDM7_9NOCA|nr:hypothetical protein FOY51_05490 [Spelaeibacter cavernicola]
MDHLLVPSVQSRVSSWLSSTSVEPMDQKTIPGATRAERTSLAALGGLIRALTPDFPSDHVPLEISNWIKAGPTPPQHLVGELTGVFEARPNDLLAQLYSSAVRPANRRHLGTFFTPAEQVEYMVETWMRTQASPRAVVDVGAGVGVFSTLSARIWDEANVYAVDVNPVTLGLMASHIGSATKIVGESSDCPGIRLVLNDYTRWIASDSSPIGGPRLFLGNPPYTRAQLLTTEDRERLTLASGGLCSRRASLSAHITAITLLHLRPSDGMCLLLPAQWLESQYADRLRSTLWQLKNRRVELHLVDSWRFEDAQVDAVALMVGAESSTTEDLTFSRWGAETSIKVSRDAECPSSWRALFAQEDRRCTRPRNVDLGMRKRVSLRDLAQVRRGTATGANDFFLLSREQQGDLALRDELFTPVVRRMSNARQRITRKNLHRLEPGGRDLILLVTNQDRLQSIELDEYLSHGEALGFHERVLCARRDCWFDLHHDVFIPDVIIGAMTRAKFKITINSAEAAITNNLYGWKWRDSTSPIIRRRVVSWLRSDSGQGKLHSVARHQSNNLMKLEPSALAGLSIPTDVLNGAVTYTDGGTPKSQLGKTPRGSSV